MVSILPSERSPWDVIGSSIGKNISQNLPGAVEKGYERGQIQQGLEKLKNLSPDQIKNLQPHQLIAEVLGPFAGTRQGAQYAEAILPSLQKMIQRNQIFPGGEGQGNPQMGGGNAGNANQNPLPDFLGGMAKSKQGNPTAGEQAFNFTLPGQGNPQTDLASTENPTLAPGSKSVNEILNQASNSADPFAVLDFYSKSNKLAEDQRQNLYDQYLRNFEKEENRMSRENQFRNFAKGATLDKKYDSDDFNRLIRYSDKYITEPSQTKRLYHAERDLQRYNNAIHSLENARKAPNFLENITMGQGPAQKQLQSAVKPLVELGEIDKGKELIAQLGFGPLQTERIVNPLPSESKNVLSKIKPATSSYANVPGERGGPQITARNEKKRANDLAKLPDLIKDSIEAGDNFTSLKLIRDDLFKKGYLEHEFSTALEESIKNGLKLSDYQKTEVSELGRRQRRPLIDIFNFSPDPGQEIDRSLRGYE